MKLTIEIAEVPPTLNQLMRKGWKFRWRLGKQWQDLMACGTSAQERNALRRAKGIRRIALYCRHMQLWDAGDNAQSAYKVILDAGTRLGWWKDDSAEFLTCAPVEQEKVARRSEVVTRVTIEVAEAQDAAKVGATITVTSLEAE